MAFVKGNRHAARSKLFEKEIRKALKADLLKGRNKLREIAERLIDFCLTEEPAIALQAIRELGDRLDGRPNQRVEASVEHTVNTGDECSLSERLEAAAKARQVPTVQ